MVAPTWTEVDGVPVVWSPVPGRARAVLQFRVGEADETAARHGVTHLVEHLALHGIHERPYEANGRVDLTRTMFYCSGGDDDVVDFLGRVCARLADLPDERVEVERGVLRAEEALRSVGYRDVLLGMRYGAQRYGLPAVEAFGLEWLTAAAVRDWAASRFTRANAVLWLTGPPPAGLRLPLADGPWHPPVEPVPMEPVVPGWFSRRCEGVALSTLLPRGVAAALASAVVTDELTRRLRFDSGLTYAVFSVAEQLGPGLVHAVFSADADHRRHAALRDEFLEVVTGLAERGPSPAAMERLRAGLARAAADEDAMTMTDLDRLAGNRLAGVPSRPRAELDAEQDAATADDLHAVLREVPATAMLLLPAGTDPPAAGFPPVPMTSPDAVEGTSYPPAGFWTANDAPDTRLVCGQDGVSIVGPEGPVTVRWRDTVAVAWWENGARYLLGRDGFRLRIVPGEWQQGGAIVAWLDRAAPRETFVPLGPDGPEAAPLVPVTVPRERGFSDNGLKGGAAIAFLIGALLLVAALDGPEPATPTREAITEADIRGMAIVGVLALLTAVAALVALLRRRRAARAADPAGQAERGSVPS